MDVAVHTERRSQPNSSGAAAPPSLDCAGRHAPARMSLQRLEQQRADGERQRLRPQPVRASTSTLRHRGAVAGSHGSKDFRFSTLAWGARGLL